MFLAKQHATTLADGGAGGGAGVFWVWSPQLSRLIERGSDGADARAAVVEVRPPGPAAMMPPPKRRRHRL